MSNVNLHPWKFAPGTLEPTPLISLPRSGDLLGVVDVFKMHTDQGYPIGVMTADGNQGSTGRALHIEAPWSEAVLDRPDAGPRNLAFAKAMGAYATIIDAPGIGIGVPQLPRATIDGIWHGDLHEAARMQASILDAKLGARAVSDSYGLGSSQGAIMLAASMATAPEGVHYDGVIFNEAPGLAKQDILTFSSRFAVDTVLQQKKLAAYRAETPGEGEYMTGNPTHQRKLAKSILRHPAHYAAYVAAMSADRLEDDIATAYERNIIDHSTELVFVTGTNSHVSPVEWNYVRAKNIRQRFGLGSVHLVTLEGQNHAMYESTARTHAMLRKVREDILGIFSDAA